MFKHGEKLFRRTMAWVLIFFITGTAFISRMGTVSLASDNMYNNELGEGVDIIPTENPEPTEMPEQTNTPSPTDDGGATNEPPYEEGFYFEISGGAEFISGVKVEIIDSVTGNITGTYYSDEKGRALITEFASLSNLTEEVKYNYKISKGGYIPQEGELKFPNVNALKDYKYIYLSEIKPIRVSGMIYEEIDGKNVPIQWANIVLKNKENGDVYNQYFSSSDGSWVMRGIPNYGDYTICVNHKDYKFMEQDLDNKNGDKEDIIILGIRKQEQGEFEFEISNPNPITYETNNGVFENRIDEGKAGGGTGNIRYRIKSGFEYADIDEITGILTLKRAGGTVVVQAIKENDDDYSEGIAEYNVNILFAENDTLKFADSSPEDIVYGQTISHIATSTKGTGSISYNVTDPNGNILSNEGETFEPKKAGKYKIEAVQEGDNFYKEASAYYEIVVKKAGQLEFKFENPTPDDIKTTDKWFINRAVGAPEGSNVTYYIFKESKDNIASINKDTGEIYNIKKSGEIIVEARNSGNENYEECSIRYNLTIRRAKDNSFRFGCTNPGKIPYKQYFTNKAFAESDSVGITYKIDSTSAQDIASIDENGRLTIYKAGKIRVIAQRAEDDKFESSEIYYDLEITKAEQRELKFVDNSPRELSYGDEYKFEAEGGTTNNELIYSIEKGNNYATISKDGYLKTRGVGTVSIKVIRPGDDCYKDKIAYHSVVIGKAEQSPIKFKFTDPEVYCDEILENPVVKEGGTYGTGGITYKIVQGNNLADIGSGDGLVVAKSYGDVIVEAEIAGDENFNSVKGNYTLKIKPLKQTDFEFEAFDQDKVVIGTKFGKKASGIQSSGEVTYEIVSGKELAQVDRNGNLIYIGNGLTGKVKVAAQKAGDLKYEISDKKYYEIEYIYDEIPEDPYIILGTKASNDKWYTEDIKIIPKEGYKIFLSVSCDWNNWKDELLYDMEGISSQTVYFRNIENEGITKALDINDIMIDKTAPDINSMSIEYDTPVTDAILQSISMGFYKAPVTVTIKAKDNESKITGFEYSYLVLEEENNKEVKKVEEKDISYNNDIAEVSFKIPAQFYGSVSFTAIDEGDHTTIKNDTKVIVVDDIAPNVNIKYNAPTGMVNKDTLMSVNTVSENTVLFYDKAINSVITVAENNFFEGVQGEFDINSDVAVYVEKKDYSDHISKIDYVPYEVYNDSSDLSKKQINWTEENGIYKTELLFDEEGEYIVHIKYMDKSGNEMNFSSNTDKKTGLHEYTSNSMVIDKTPPEIRIAGSGIEQNKFYKESKEITIQVKENYFNPSNLNVNVKALDVEESSISGVDISKIIYDIQNKENWTKSSDGWWSNKVLFDKDANYTLELSYRDLAGNESKNNPKIQFSIDKMAPALDNMTISYSTSALDKVIENVTFGYYKAPVKITIKARDNVSGVNGFTYYYPLNQNVSTVNTGNSEGTAVDSVAIRYNGKKEAEYSFEIPAQYVGKVSFEAVDKAGNASSVCYGDRVIVVDDISPECNVVYEPVHVVDAVTLKTKEAYGGGNSILYYNSDALINMEIKEANFYPEDVKIMITKNNDITYAYNIDKWDSIGDIRNGVIRLTENGDYIININYTDRSGNIMKSYVSDKIVIDKLKPQINVTYNNEQIIQNYSNIDYYDKAQTVAIKVIDKNFRAEDIKVEVSSKDISGNDVIVKDYDSYLKNRSSWTNEGDSYTAEITYSEDANYTFNIEYMDLALNRADVYDADYFTVDKTAPQNLTVTYSESVFDTVLQSVSFGYYNAPVTVTITAEDETSGIESFDYSYIKEEGLSSSSAELLNQKLKEAQITYSDNKKKATATFTVPKNAISDFEQFRGSIEFSATDKAGLKSEVKEKKKLVVDSISPKMEVTYNEPQKTENNISYYAGEVTATFKITEANFYPEDVKISLDKDGSVSDITPVQWTQNQDSWTSVVRIQAPSDNSQDGSYVFIVNLKDRSGNTMDEYKSGLIVVDTKEPEVEITGISDKSANNQEVIGFTITAKDKNFEVFTPELTAVVQNEAGKYEEVNVDFGEVKTVVQGEEYNYTLGNLESDGVYSLKCRVIDKAGNVNSNISIYNNGSSESQKVYEEGENILAFSVNRNGSTFTFNKETLKLIDKYYVQSVEDNIRLEEINVDSLEEYDIYINKEKLIKGTDYTVDEVDDEGSWHKYIYTLKNELFSEEGEYAIIAASKDKTGTVAYSDIKQTEINFIVDRTKPEVIISGLENEGRYRTDVQQVTVIPKDPGGKVKEIRVIQNKGENLLQLSSNELQEKLTENNEKLKFPVYNGMNQRVQIICVDEAGNENTLTYDKITVSTDWYVLFYANKPLFFGAVAGGSAVTAGGVSVAVLMRKGKFSFLKKLFRR